MGKDEPKGNGNKLPLKRVLHVDDRENWVSTVRMVLEGHGYEVTSFENLSSAKEAAAKGEFDYYICDRQLLGQDGGVWAAELRSQGKKAMILATESYEDVPFVSKRLPEWPETLRAFLQAL